MVEKVISTRVKSMDKHVLQEQTHIKLTLKITH